MSAPDLTLVSDTGVSVDIDRPILIPEAEYDFMLTNIWKGYMYKGRAPKVFLTFRIMTEGPYYGQHLKRHYNVKGFTKKNEVISRGWTSDLVREYTVLFGLPRTLKDIGLTKFKGKVIRGKVKTVKTNNRGNPLAEPNWHSCIDELTKLITG